MSVILSDCCGPSHSTPATLSADTHLTAARKPCRSLKHSARARLGELHHNLDVIGLPLQGLPEVLRPLAPRYEARHPGAVRPGEDLASLVPVPFVGVDAAHDDVIFQHHRGRNVGRDEPGQGAAGRDQGASKPVLFTTLFGS
jgi:hypothetical protein